MSTLLSLFRSENKTLVVFIIIPLLLSAITHMWNPLGFPTFHVDEGHYMRRTMQVLEGLGPQEAKETYEYGYDHPFFGQIFLAATLSLIDYPHSLSPSVNLQTVEMLYLVPRALMGVLAVIDTLLVFKIAEIKYSRRIGFISATLFAVMPLSQILRGILLDSIELPFILLSILFAVYYAKSQSQIVNNNKIDKNIMLVLLSGIFLGLAIFTKVPVFTMIPLLVIIILNRNMPGKRGNIKKWNNLKILGIWFVPVVLISMMWPVYAISVGQFGNWLDGVLYQTGRQGGTDFAYSIRLVTQIDPILVTLGLAAVIFSVIKKDYFVLFWTIPYLLFLGLIGWVVYFHWSVILPILCISLGILVESLRERFEAHKLIRPLPYIMISAIAIFGLLSFTISAKSDLNATYNEVYLFVTRELLQNDVNTDNRLEEDEITLIGSHRTRALIWIPKYVFGDGVIFRDTDLPNDNFTEPLQTRKFLIVADSNAIMKFAELNQDEKYSRITRLYHNTSSTIATFIDEMSRKHDLFKLHDNHGLGQFVEVRANY